MSDEKLVTVFAGTTGLNNIVDPVRLKLDLETGIVELAESVNMLIDPTGRLSRRPGSVPVAAGSFHSLFCDGGDCFVIKERTYDAAIFQLGTDRVLTGVRDSLTKGQRVSWWQDGERTYYTNSEQNGIIKAGVSWPWLAQAHVGAPTTRAFFGPPLGSHIAIYAGRMFIADGPILYFSEPQAYGKYDLARCFLPYGTDIKMIKPVNGGMFISDSDRTYFMTGLIPKEFFQKPVLDSPAHEWSEAIGYIDGKNVGMPEAGPCAVWSCDEGLCVATQDGILTVVTADKLLYPTGTRGASLFYDSTVINTVE